MFKRLIVNEHQSFLCEEQPGGYIWTIHPHEAIQFDTAKACVDKMNEIDPQDLLALGCVAFDEEELRG